MRRLDALGEFFGSSMAFSMRLDDCLPRFVVQALFSIKIAHFLEHLSEIIDIASEVGMSGAINGSVDGQGSLEAFGGLGIAQLEQLDLAEAAQRGQFAAGVPAGAGDPQRGLVQHLRGAEMSPSQQMLVQGRGQVLGIARSAVRGDREQVGQFGVQPGHRPRPVIEEQKQK